MRFRMEKMLAVQKGQTKRLEGYENAPESVKESVGYYDKARPYYMSFYERAYNYERFYQFYSGPWSHGRNDSDFL